MSGPKPDIDGLVKDVVRDKEELADAVAVHRRLERQTVDARNEVTRCDKSLEVSRKRLGEALA